MLGLVLAWITLVLYGSKAAFAGGVLGLLLGFIWVNLVRLRVIPAADPAQAIGDMAFFTMQPIHTPMNTTGSNGAVRPSQTHPARSAVVCRVFGAHPFVGHGGV
jgi:hypothetical protein